MSFLKKLFKKNPISTIPKGFHTLTVEQLIRHTDETVEVRLAVPTDLQHRFTFIPGQYLNFSVTLNGIELRRSYSICSAPGESLAVAVKRIPNGVISHWFNDSLTEGTELLVSEPHGHFNLKDEKTIVGVAAGSGITPLMSIAKAAERNGDQQVRLFYANRTEASVLFRSDIDSLKHTTPTYFLTQEDKEGFESGRITKDRFIQLIKEDLNLLKADGFFICGPEDMIFGVRDALQLFGVPEDKIHYELFTTPTHTPPTTHENIAFSGTSKVSVTLDDEVFHFDLDAGGKTILEVLNKEGADAPYSCKGGVCSTCKAKVLKGKVNMDLNYTLTDREIDEGYILTCQSHPASEELEITYDDV